MQASSCHNPLCMDALIQLDTVNWRFLPDLEDQKAVCRILSKVRNLWSSEVIMQLAINRLNNMIYTLDPSNNAQKRCIILLLNNCLAIKFNQLYQDLPGFLMELTRFLWGVYNRWTGLVDWTSGLTTGLIDFHLKCTKILHNVTQSTTMVEQHAG